MEKRIIPSIGKSCIRRPVKRWRFLWKMKNFRHLKQISKENIFSRESNSRIANVRLSVRLSQKPLSLSELLLSAIEPINHQAYYHHAYQPLSLSTIEPINHRAYRPSSLLTLALLSRLLSLSACFESFPYHYFKNLMYNT